MEREWKDVKLIILRQEVNYITKLYSLGRLEEKEVGGGSGGGGGYGGSGDGDAKKRCSGKGWTDGWIPKINQSSAT